MIFISIMLISNLFFLLSTPGILEIRTVDILKLFTTGLLSGVLIVFLKDWFRNRKQENSELN